MFKKFVIFKLFIVLKINVFTQHTPNTMTKYSVTYQHIPTTWDSYIIEMKWSLGITIKKKNLINSLKQSELRITGLDNTETEIGQVSPSWNI